MSIKEYIVSSDMTILDTMAAINKNGQGVVYVCDDLVLKGVVTDGDIRRHILNGGNTVNAVISIANKKPKILTISTSSNAAEFMKLNRINSIPILNERQEILSIDFLYSKKEYLNGSLDLPVVIMAGGKGTRLQPYTQILPKPLIPIGDKTITERIMDSFKNFGCNKFSMIVNYKKEFIKAYFADKAEQYDIDFVFETEFMGTGGGLKLVKDSINSDFILSNCDILVDVDISEVYRYHLSNQNLITILGVEKKVTIPYGVLNFNEDKVQITEKPEYSFVTNSGIYILSPTVLNYIHDNEFIHITDIIERCTLNKEKVGVFTIDEHNWMDMGQLDELDRMREKFANAK